MNTMRPGLLDPVWFCLLGWPPFEVVFEGKPHRFEFHCRLLTNDCWDLIAEFFGGYIAISEDFRRLAWLEDAMIEGFATRHGTSGERIMLLCVRLHYAAPMPQPQYLPEAGRGKPWNPLGC